MQRLIDNATRFFRRWGRDVALAGAGAALGLVVVLVFAEGEQPSATAQQQPVAAAAPDRPAAVRRGPVAVLPPERPPVMAPPLSVPDAISPAEPPAFVAPQPAWRKYAAAHGATGGRPMIAVIIDDMGLDRRRSARAMALPGPLTMSFLTYAIGLRGQAEEARRRGHELMVHVPMEPHDRNAHPGPKVIATGLAPEEIRRRLDWALERMDSYVGVNNHMGSRFTTDEAGMTQVLGAIGERGLLFVDSRTTALSVARKVATELAVPFAERHVFLDDSPALSSVRRQLEELERIARKQGYAVAIGHPRDTTLQALEEWLPELAARGFVLVPVSAVVRHRQEAG